MFCRYLTFQEYFTFSTPKHRNLVCASGLEGHKASQKKVINFPQFMTVAILHYHDSHGFISHIFNANENLMAT